MAVGIYTSRGAEYHQLYAQRAQQVRVKAVNPHPSFAKMWLCRERPAVISVAEEI